jgi:hypothetical protein
MKWRICKDLPMAASQCLQLGPPSPCALLVTHTVVSRLETTTIVAHIRPRVVIFLFDGRNSGQQKRKEEERSRRGVGQLGASLRRRLHLHVSDRAQQCLSCLRGAQGSAGLLIRPEYMFGRRTESCPPNKLWS